MGIKLVSYDTVSEWRGGHWDDPSGKGTNSAQVERAKKIALQIIQEQLTPRQREILLAYFYGKQSMSAIGKELGINKSTVSRTVARGLKRLNERMRYYNFR